MSGSLLRGEDAGYDEARQIHNGLIDKCPMLKARCRGTAHVVDAPALAQEAGLEISCAAAVTTWPDERSPVAGS